MKNNYKMIRPTWILILVLGVFNLSMAQKKVIAYIPNWIDLNSFSTTIQYSKLTHINIAFENPDANGYLTFNSGSNAIINAAHAQNVKVFVSLGGGAISEGGAIRDNYFNLITPGNRTAFIQKIYDYVIAHNFDGVDVDLEGPAINGDYGGFVIALANKLHSGGKQITAALSEGYGGANVPVSTFAAYDWINIMAYDATGPWNPANPGPHSPYSMAVNQFNYWTGRGLPASKAIIGLPFYGYGFGAAANQGISFANIVAQYPGSENQDQVGNTIYYNGIPTIKAKTTFAIQNAGGVMIWELSQDAVGAKSLLTAVDQVVKGTNPPTGTLIQAESYSSMSGIQTEPTTDTGGGLNVGYADTGDWMAYFNINFPTSGNYVIEYRVASAVSGARLSSDLNAGTIQLGAVNVPNTGGWQNWQTVSQTVNINAGTYNFGIYIQNSGVNLNWFRITKPGSALTAKSAVAATDKIESLSIYPNPTEQILFFSAAVSGANVSIIDSQSGAAISKQTVNNNSIDVAGLKSGIYLILVEKDGIKTVRRFIKK